FLNLLPTFVPTGFFSLLLQSLQSVEFPSTAGTQALKSSFGTLPLPVYKTLARLFFVVQQASLTSGDVSLHMKMARYLQPILIKDTIELDALNSAKLIQVLQTLIREADFIFSLAIVDTSNIPAPSTK